MQTVITKAATETVNLSFTYTLATGETITSAVIAATVLRGTDAAPSALLSGSKTISGAKITQLVQGGIENVVYLVSSTATTSTGQVLLDECFLTIAASSKKSVLFIKALDVYNLRINQLAIAGANYGNLTSVTDDAIWAKLLAAEADLSRRLQVSFGPLEVFPEQPTDAEISALNGNPFIVEPGYNLPPDFFGLGNFGMFQLRQRPVISITQVKLVYPNAGGVSFIIPDNWIRLDNKYGHVHLFPTAQTITAPLTLMTLQAVGAGYDIPHMIRVHYIAGIDANNGLYPDIVDLVKRMAVLRLLYDSFLPSSGSLSADGLSESQSTDLSKMQDGLENQIETLKQSLLGVVFTVL